VPIALACTASSALPVKFAMVKIQNRYYQDAGLKLQIPSDLFTNEASADNTLLFLFNHTIWHGLINQDNDTYWNNAQSDLKRVDDLYMPMINSIFVLVNMYVLFIKSLFYPVMMLYFYLAQDSSKIKDYSDELFELVRHVYRMPISFSQVTSSLTTFSLVNGPYKKQIVLLDAATILTTSFFKAHEKSKMLQCLFYLDTMEFLIERKLYGGQAVACLDHFYDEIMTSYYQHLFHDMSHDSSKLDSKLEYKALRELINKDINRCEAKALENSVLDLMGKHTLFNDLNFNHRVGSNKSYSTNKNLLFTQQTLLSNTNSINSPPSTDDTDHCGHIHHR